MRAMRRWRKLGGAERLRLLEALLWVALVRLGLWLLPFRAWRGLLAELPARPGGPSADEAARLARAVRAASRRVPAASCLTQALATRLMLGRRGGHALIRIGVARGPAGQLEAHAWVESAGRVVIGGSDASLARYAVLPRARSGQAGS